MMKPRLYLETTIPSYRTSRPSRDLIIASHQQITRDWWETRKGGFRLFISQLVIDEAGGGDPAAARERLKALQHLPLLDITPEVAELAAAILDSGIIPRRAATDAAHIAIADCSRHGVPGNLELRAHRQCGDRQSACCHLPRGVNVRSYAHRRNYWENRSCQGTPLLMKSGAFARARLLSTGLTLS